MKQPAQCICWDSFNMMGFGLGPLPQGQMREVKFKRAYKLFIIGLRDFDA